MLKAENPHCLESGALNDMQDEDEGGIVQSDRLSLKYNALDFRCPDSLIKQANHEDAFATQLDKIPACFPSPHSSPNVSVFSNESPPTMQQLIGSPSEQSGSMAVPYADEN